AAAPSRSALARLVARVGLVDHIDPPLAPHDPAIAVALLEALQGIDDLHHTGPSRGAEDRDEARPSQPARCWKPVIARSRRRRGKLVRGNLLLPEIAAALRASP